MKAYLTLFAIVSLCVSPVFATYYYSAGHADIGLGEHGQIELHLHTGPGAIVNGVALTEGLEFNPDDVVIVVPGNTYFARPTGTQWDFLGNAAGENTWRLPQSGGDATTLNAPHLGISAEEVDFDVFVDNKMTLRLIDVDGPGHFSLYRIQLGEPVFFMTTSDGISMDDSIEINAGAHRHFNFGFTAPGEYVVTFEAAGIHGEGLMTDQATFTFYVVPEPATVSLLLLGAAAILRPKK